MIWEEKSLSGFSFLTFLGGEYLTKWIIYAGHGGRSENNISLDVALEAKRVVQDIQERRVSNVYIIPYIGKKWIKDNILLKWK